MLELPRYILQPAPRNKFVSPWPSHVHNGNVRSRYFRALTYEISSDLLRCAVRDKNDGPYADLRANCLRNRAANGFGALGDIDVYWSILLPDPYLFGLHCSGPPRRCRRSLKLFQSTTNVRAKIDTSMTTMAIYSSLWGLYSYVVALEN